MPKARIWHQSGKKAASCKLLAAWELAKIARSGFAGHNLIFKPGRNIQPVEDIQIKRKLTAILSADAVSYSRMMSENEEQTLRSLAGNRHIVDAIIAAHEGRIVNTAGDSVLAEFPSSVEAVRCAIEIQDAIKTRNDTLPEDQRMVFRIGVNLGDVMISGTDLLGDGINVAARLQSIAEPGGICISSSVYDQISGKIDLGFVDLGEQALKNITRPIRVYQLSGVKKPVSAKPVHKPVRYGIVWISVGLAAGIAIFVLAWQSGWLAGQAPATSPASAEKAASQVVDTAMQARVAELEKSSLEAERARAKAELEKLRMEEKISRKLIELERQKVEIESEKHPRKAEPLPPTPQEQPSATTPSINMEAAEITRKSEGSAPVALKPAIQKRIGTLSCPPFEDRPQFNYRLPITVREGEFIFEKGQAGEPGYIFLKGKPENNQLTLAGNVISGVPSTIGRQGSANMAGNFEGNAYNLKGKLGRRPCVMTIEGGR